MLSTLFFHPWPPILCPRSSRRRGEEREREGGRKTEKNQTRPSFENRIWKLNERPSIDRNLPFLRVSLPIPGVSISGYVFTENFSCRGCTAVVLGECFPSGNLPRQNIKIFPVKTVTTWGDRDRRLATIVRNAGCTTIFLRNIAAAAIRSTIKLIPPILFGFRLW